MRSCGRWYICFSVETPDAYGPHPFREAVGIDVGLTNLIATSDGETVPTPKWVTKASRKQRRLQRALARCKRGSKGRLRAKMRLARHSARTANQRRDFTHKLSHDLVNRYSHIAFEDLNITGLASGLLAKFVLNAAWGQLISFTDYKAANAGGLVTKVNPRGTSQECDCRHDSQTADDDLEHGLPPDVELDGAARPDRSTEVVLLAEPMPDSRLRARSISIILP